MSEQPSPRETMLAKILDTEWQMFRSVKASEPAACQEERETFRMMRWMSHSVLPEEVLAQLLEHLEAAARAGRNLMTEKYARMEGQIAPLKSSPLIGDIVQAERAWLQALQRRYPLTFPGTGERFETYLSCELETYSDPLLAACHRFIMEAREAGRNLVEERYAALFKRMGYPSIEAREQKGRMDAMRCSCH